MTISTEEQEKLFARRLAHVKRPWWGRGFEEEMAPVFASVVDKKLQFLAAASSNDATWGECSERLLEMLEADVAAGVERLVIPEIDKDNQLMLAVVGKLELLEARLKNEQLIKSLPREENWVGGDVYITANREEAQGRLERTVLLTKLAGPINWLLNELRNTAEGFLDARTEPEFFGEVAAAVREYIAQHGEEEKVLEPLLSCAVQAARAVVSDAAHRQRSWIGQLAEECTRRQAAAP